MIIDTSLIKTKPVHFLVSLCQQIFINKGILVGNKKTKMIISNVLNMKKSLDRFSQN